jgi:ATP-dependent exoDNAse (exonuclease V) beta subunit
MEAQILGRSFDPDHPALLSLAEEDRSLLLAEARRLARGFSGSGLQGLISGAEELQVEKSLLLALPGPPTLVIKARLDLLALGGEEALIVDWKSGAERRPEEFEVQMALYRRAVEALYPGLRARSFVHWLRSGQTDELEAGISLEELRELAREAAKLPGEDSGSGS